MNHNVHADRICMGKFLAFFQIFFRWFHHRGHICAPEVGARLKVSVCGGLLEIIDWPFSCIVFEKPCMFLVDASRRSLPASEASIIRPIADTSQQKSSALEKFQTAIL
jgi:hypothetical protein